ncbi:hypothetical protein [Sphingomonas sp. UNC305MFCol5.2]|uniref:hypothetical protein n=1 Tax=Sphingomonas sp. UNC305MFCol5.2 TaxID=1449076 RepID=UPI001E56B0D8|nr:hypothetical protein [Sphingomonas sp. UNC305MFCol5.2]
MRPPPTRYKVVERGRRLEVIDTLTGEPVSRPSVPLPLVGTRGGEGGLGPRDLPAPPASGTRTGTAGIDSNSFVTRRWYDDRAPRTIRLNYATRSRFTQLRYGAAIAIALLVVLSFLFWPIAIFLVFALAAGPKLRAQLRAASTSWIDGLDQAA